MVGFVNADVFAPGVMRPNDQEVAQVFTLSIEQLLDPAHHTTEVLEGTGAHRHKVREIASVHALVHGSV